jgi:signal transduction histidine kinase
MARFVVVSIAALVALGTVTVLVDRRLAETTTLSEVERRTSQFSHNVVAPLIDSEFRSGAAGEKRQTVEELLRNRMSDGSIVHIKIWSQDGQVIWSDESQLIGQVFELGADEKALFGTVSVISDLSHLDKVENATEAGEGPLLEVYSAALDADGLPLLFEAYWATNQLQAEQDATLTRTVPVSLGVLLVFLVVVLWLAFRLARDVERKEMQRRALVSDALAASELERGRLAQDLHDGVIQDLSGLSYAIPAIVAELPEEARSSRRVLEQVAIILQRDIAALRSLLTDIYPAELESGGLVDEVEVLAERAGERGVDVHVLVSAEVAGVSLDVSRLAYRVIREGLRNVVTHADASEAWVRAMLVEGQVVVEVEDDGRGVRDAQAEPGSAADSGGHVGLRLLAETLRRLGGRLSLSTGVSGGALLRASFPVSLVDFESPLTAATRPAAPSGG